MLRHASRFLFSGLLAVAWMAGCAGGSRIAAEEPSRPNIIFILTDDHRWDGLGAAGNEIIQTPNLDDVAADGVRFPNAFVTTPICAISRASFFSGQYERRHDIHNFRTSFSPEAYALTYPELFRDAGYWTGFVGKYGVGKEMPADSFDVWNGIPGQPTYETVDEEGRPIHLTRLLGRQSVSFLENVPDDRPFHLSVSFKAPHVQDKDPRQFIYDPAYEKLYEDVTIPVPETAGDENWERLPEFFRENNEARHRWKIRFATPEMYQESVKGYYRLITGVDDVVGRIRKVLRRTGHADDTVIIFMGDNGYYLGEHGLAGKWYGHDESIRVPLLVYDPRLPEEQRGQVIDEMALNIDIAPTMLSYAGMPVPEEMQGRDLRPLIRGEDVDWREDFLFEHLFQHGRIPKSDGVVTARYKYLRFIDQNPVYEMLFDLEKDPHETTNVASDPDYATVLTRLRDRYQELVAEASAQSGAVNAPLPGSSRDRDSPSPGAAAPDRDATSPASEPPGRGAATPDAGAEHDGMAAIERSFKTPPDDARPHTWWHWINGHISKAGITADLEAMKAVGLGGATLFNIGLINTIPGPVEFMSPKWWEMVDHALLEAEGLGLELSVHNADGWSQSGGPWIRPEESMKRLVWTETHVSGPSSFDAVLPQPEAFADFYRDVAVVAVPSAKQGKNAGAAAQVVAPGVDGSLLTDGDPSTSVMLPGGKREGPYRIELSFAEPLQTRSLTLVMNRLDRRIRFGLEDVTLHISDDGRTFRPVADVPVFFKFSTRSTITVGFDAVRARHYRLDFKTTPRLDLAEIILSPAPWVPLWEVKSGYIQHSEYGGETELYARTPAPEAPSKGVVARDEVRDVTAKLGADGVLKWEVPAGEWTLLRIGYTSTGEVNHPATEAGRGLEVDKMSRAAVEKHFDAMVGKILDREEQLGTDVVTHALLDSWEAGTQNWTAGFAEEFEERRGYDLLPFLPVLAGGRVVGGFDASDRFLRDFRLTAAELMAENYWGNMRALSHQRGIELMGEATGPGQYLYHPERYHRNVDVPMGEFWVPDDFQRPDMKAAASTAHTHGLPLVAAEAFTGRSRSWDLDPFAMKAAGDAALTQGVNWFILHSFVHQPYDQLRPGFTLGKFGNHFQRHNTWFPESGAWVDYLARSQYLLRHGQFVGDVAYFTGTGVPGRLGFRNELDVPVPKGYDYDGVSAETLLRMTVRDGSLVLPEGMEYRLLVLPRKSAMTPDVVEHVRDLVAAGATVVGPKPQSAPGLGGYPEDGARVRKIADELWGRNDGGNVTSQSYGSGRVVSRQPLEEVLAEMNVPPDFGCSGTDAEADLRYIHRRSAEADIYFVSNGRYRAEDAACTFRAAGRVPELWHPDTGRIEKLAEYSQTGELTEVPLHLDPAGSVFVVFRTSSESADPIVSVARSYQNVHSSTRQSVRTTRQDVRTSPRQNPHQLLVTDDGSIEFVAWEPGTYTLTRYSGDTTNVVIEDIPDSFPIASGWTVHFPKESGGAGDVLFSALDDWSTHEDERIRHFSGTATYRTSFELPSSFADRRLFLNLGDVQNLARVRLNGEELRTLWKPPFRLEVTNTVEPGRNDLEIEVTNLWINRMIGDEHLSADVEYLGSGSIRHMPEWALTGADRPSDRQSFVTWKHVSADDALLPSGLLGPVVIQAAESRVLQKADGTPWQLIGDARRTPNIILILADDLGFGDVSTYGGDVSTPHLDRLAKEGVLFTDFHSSAPVCSPTRAGLLTGRYQQRSGIDEVLYSQPGRNRHHGLHPNEITLPELLSDAGYATGLIGKWHLGHDRRFNPIRHGFDVFHGLVSGNVDYFSHTDASGYYDWWDGDQLVNERGYVTHLLTEHALRFIEENRERPFFLYLAHQAPHTPFQDADDAPFRLVGKKTGARRDPENDPETYRNMVKELDAGVGQVTETLKRLDLDEKTLVFFLSDNGAIHGSNHPLQGRKGTLWEGGHRVPAMAWWPGHIRAGTTSAQLTISLDLMPTALAIAGADLPPNHQLDGTNLLPHLLDETDLDARILFWQQGKHASVRDGSWKLLREGTGADGIHLFNLEADPYERENLAAANPTRVQKMLDALERWRSDVAADTTVQVDP